MNSLNICLVGFGNAAQEFCRLLMDKHQWIKTNFKYDVKVTAICTKNKGTLINTSGIDLKAALDELIHNNGKFKSSNTDLVEANTVSAIASSNAQIMIELSTLSINDGQPAISHIKTAFNNGMNVITANKGPIAWDYKRLSSIAADKNLKFFYETTVMDGTPVFNLLKYTLPGCKVLGFKGIVNSTTNFILEEMENGSDYNDAIKEAQRRGFAEADPSLDIDGWDAAAKTAALANVLMDADITPMDIDRTGITNITLQDVLNAKKENKKIKLVSEGIIKGGKVFGKVYPSLFSCQDIFSTIDSTTSILSISTDLMGELSIIEKNPKIQQTAYGIFSDLINLIRGM